MTHQSEQSNTLEDVLSEHLTPEKFLLWLESLPPNTRIGPINGEYTSRSCPLATYLGEQLDFKVCISSVAIGQDYPLSVRGHAVESPKWVEVFVKCLDTISYDKKSKVRITPLRETCINIMSGIIEGRHGE